MKDQRRTEIKVGITVIIGLLAFLWILGWAKNFSLSDTQKTVKVRFANVDGLEIGDYVTINGLRKGNVEEFEMNSDQIIVTLKIDKDVTLKKDAMFAVTMLDLMGGKKINIQPGKDMVELNYSEIQNGVFYADIPQVMALVGSMQNDILTVMSDVKVTLSSINKYLTDDNLNKNIKSSMQNLTEISIKLNGMIDENRQNLKVLTSNGVELTKDARNFIADNKESIKTSITQVQDLLNETGKMISKINSLVDETTNKNNNVGKLLYDDQLFTKLNEMLLQVKEMVNTLNSQLKNEGIKVDAEISIF